MRATSLLVFTCYFVLTWLNKDFTYLLTYLGIYSLPTTYLGTNIVTTIARRQILLLAGLEAFYLAVWLCDMSCSNDCTSDPGWNPGSDPGSNPGSKFRYPHLSSIHYLHYR